MGMVIKTYKLFTLGIIMMLSASASAGDLNALYHQDYDGFWELWKKTKSEAVECIDERKTKLFLSNAISMLGNSEVTEANASVIEGIALKNPKCLLTTMNQMESTKQNKLFENFLFSPLYGLSKGSAGELPESEKRGAALVVFEAIIEFTNRNHANPQQVPFYTDGLFVALAEIDHPISKKLLVDLYDYYLGSAFGAQHEVLVSNMGVQIIPALEEKLINPISCLNNIERFPSLRCSDKEQRNIRIMKNIKRIKDAKPLKFIP